LQNDREKELDREDKPFKKQIIDEVVFHKCIEKLGKNMEVDSSLKYRRVH
jgi:hypothetical protein